MSTQASVIGEGTYGCIHKPSLRCKGNKKLNYTNAGVFGLNYLESQ